MRTVQDVEKRLDRAKVEYLREVAACDRDLQGIVRVDPSHLEAAKAVQDALVVTPETLELKPNVQPDAPAAKKSKK